MDNSSTHTTPAIHARQLAHPRFHFHFTPTSSSWLNLVEQWFAELTRRLFKRGIHRSVTALERDMRAWSATWNENPRPFVWHKTADEILESLARYLTRTLNWVTSGQTGRLPAPSRCLHGAGDVGDVETLAESRPMIASHGFGRELLVGLAGTRGLGGGVQAISAVVAWIAV